MFGLRSVVKYYQIRQIHCSAALAVQGIRAEGWWIKDHRPRKFPTTPEARAAAAARYGLRTGDYKPMDPDTFPMGDYPELGHVTYGHKDPYEAWSNDKYRRNFGEPAPRFFTCYLPDRNTFTQVEGYTTLEVLYKFFGCLFLFFGGLYMLVKYDLDNVKPVMAKQYAWDFKRAFPSDNPSLYPLVHYTFETANAAGTEDEATHDHHGHHHHH